MLILPQNPEEGFYDIIAKTEPQILVLGEMSEQWTSMALRTLEQNNIPVCFFPWSKISEVRIQLELTRYPVTQFWMAGEIQDEIIGYQEEHFSILIKKFLKRKR